MNKLLYGVREKPKKLYEWIVYALQQVLAVFVATVLIAQLCGTPVSAALFGACVGTLVYQVITRFRSPVFISSSGATVSAVQGALALSVTGNYLMVFIGGLVIMAVYGIFALIAKFTGPNTMTKIFPPTIIGAVTIVIGLNLSKFLVGYLGQSSADFNPLSTTAVLMVVCALITMFVTALTAHYGKGFLKNIPFLVGIGIGYIVALIITWTGLASLVDFSAFGNLSWYPDLVFLRWKASDWSWVNFGRTIILFAPVAICAILEHYSDHKVLSNIIDQDLTIDPGLDKTLMGDGVASAIGTAVCGLPNTTYGESIATVGFSRVASVWVVTVAAAILGLLSFIGPVAALIDSIPSAVFGGAAMILYGFIAASGLKTIINNKVDLEDNRNLIIISVVLTTGVSGIIFLDYAFGGVALAMVLGVVLNLILRKPKENKG